MACFKLLISAALCLLPEAMGRFILQFPDSRNSGNTVSTNCPGCAGGRGVCGNGEGGVAGTWVTDAEAELLDGRYTTPLTQVIAGGLLETAVRFAGTWPGHYEVQICYNPGETITEDCFVALERDPTDTRFSPYDPRYPTQVLIPQPICGARFNRNNPQRVRFRVPDFALSSHAIIRLRTQGAYGCNSTPALTTGTALDSVKNWVGYVDGLPCEMNIVDWGKACGVDCPNLDCEGNQYTNCADVYIRTGPPHSLTSANSHIVLPQGVRPSVEPKNCEA